MLTDTLVSTGRDKRVLELDPDEKVVWELRESDLPGIQLFCLMGVQRLQGGNTSATGISFSSTCCAAK